MVSDWIYHFIGGCSMGKTELSDADKLFRTEIGQRATVKREELGAEHAELMNRRLIDLGLSIQTDPEFKLSGYQYRGSAAVHIYSHDMLNLLDFVSQSYPLQLYKCPEELASRAFDDLLRRMKLTYGKSHGKLRSGF